MQVGFPLNSSKAVEPKSTLECIFPSITGQTRFSNSGARKNYSQGRHCRGAGASPRWGAQHTRWGFGAAKLLTGCIGIFRDCLASLWHGASPHSCRHLQTDGVLCWFVLHCSKLVAVQVRGVRRGRPCVTRSSRRCFPCSACPARTTAADRSASKHAAPSTAGSTRLPGMPMRCTGAQALSTGPRPRKHFCAQSSPCAATQRQPLRCHHVSIDSHSVHIANSHQQAAHKKPHATRWGSCLLY